MAFLSRDAIEKMGFKSLGSDVKISDRASIYNAAQIELGNHVRIDDFCVLSAGPGGIEIGDYVHIACQSSMMGQARIIMRDFSGLSSRVFLYSSSDDYSGKSLTNPTTPEHLKTLNEGPVELGRHVIIGTCATVLPGVKIGDGAAIGAYGLVNSDIPESVIAVGQPCKVIKERSKDVFDLEKEVISE